MKERPIVGLDLGSTKTCMVVGLPRRDGYEIIGFGEAPCDGLRRGIITDFDAVVHSIEVATAAAEDSSGLRVLEAFIGVSGEHVSGTNHRASVPITNDNGEIGSRDVDRVLEETRNIDLDEDRRILHAIPRGFTVDGTPGIADPIGLEAHRLEVDAHVVSAKSAIIASLQKCAARAGVESAGVIFDPLASSAATLDRDDMHAGVMLLDIGGGSTDVAIYSRGYAVHTSTVPIGSMLITQDLMHGLRTVRSEAERLKREFHWRADDDDLMSVRSGGVDESIPHAALRQIIVPRLYEILRFIRSNAAKAVDREVHVEEIVLTGGGALLGGIEEGVSGFFGLPTRVGFPSPVEGLPEAMQQPQYSTAVGLLVFGPAGNARSNGRRRAPFTRRLASWLHELWN